MFKFFRYLGPVWAQLEGSYSFWCVIFKSDKFKAPKPDQGRPVTVQKNPQSGHVWLTYPQTYQRTKTRPRTPYLQTYQRTNQQTYPQTNTHPQTYLQTYHWTGSGSRDAYALECSWRFEVLPSIELWKFVSYSEVTNNKKESQIRKTRKENHLKKKKMLGLVLVILILVHWVWLEVWGLSCENLSDIQKWQIVKRNPKYQKYQKPE